MSRRKIKEIQRAARELLSAISGWEMWIATTGRRIQALADYGHDAHLPPEAIQGMGDAVCLEKRARMALQALDGHGCLPTSLRARLDHLPTYPRGPIKAAKDKTFAAEAQQSLRALRGLGSDLQEWIEQFEYAPLSVIDPTERASGADLPRPVGDRVGRGAEGGAGSRQRQRKRGRPVDTDPKADKRIFDAWSSGSYKTYEELASVLRMNKSAVESAIDRHRKRLKRAGQ
jgi:hypothetical protein